MSHEIWSKFSLAKLQKVECAWWFTDRVAFIKKQLPGYSKRRVDVVWEWYIVVQSTAHTT